MFKKWFGIGNSGGAKGLYEKISKKKQKKKKQKQEGIITKHILEYLHQISVFTFFKK
jgi:hypothetical protein